jgi:nitroreductase
MSIIDSLKWRYATKKFDSSKKISSADLQILKEAIQLAPSSYGFQPFNVLIIENPELRAKLREASYGQSQVTDASHLLVFASKTKTDADDVDDLMNLVSKTRNFPIENLKGYADFIKGAIGHLTPEQQTTWNSKQTYIAFTNLLVACAELRIDVTPMEGFLATKYDEILGLKEKGLTASVVAAVGYRAEDDATASYPKVRKTLDELFISL